MTTTIHNSSAPAKVVPINFSPEARASIKSDYKKPEAKKNKKQRHTQCWTEVIDIHRSCADLLRTSTTILPLLKDRVLLSHVVEPELLQRTVAAITRDTTNLAVELNKLGNYVGKQQELNVSEGVMLNAAQTAFHHYVNLMERFDSALYPLIEHASEQLSEALLLYAKVDSVAANKLNNDMQNIITNIGHYVRDTTGATQAGK